MTRSEDNRGRLKPSAEWREGARATAPPVRSYLRWLPVWLVWAAVSLLAIATLHAPATTAAASPAAFSTDRALEHVRRLAQAPRPIGSPAHDAARVYVVDTLRALGLSVVVEHASSSAFVAGHTMSADLQNIVARLRGTGGRERAVMLAAHYDSVEQSPGASDDASGVATLLETARALTEGPALAHDVLFLFTDAEELGMLGAQAFVAESPERDQVAVALNFDARGSHGAVTMFATSKENGALISMLARGPSHPVASSFVSTLARILPNDTDASVFAAHGIATCSFAYADGVENYHRFSDSASVLDATSVAHAGDYALSLARAFGSADLSSLRSSDEVYFDVFARVLVHYSRRAARGSSLALLAIMGAFVARAARRGHLRAARVLGSLGRALATMATVTVVTAVLGGLVGVVLPIEARMGHAKLLFAGELGLALAGALILRRISRPSTRVPSATALETWTGIAAVWAVALAIVTAAAPDASAPFFWPLLLALLVAALRHALVGRPQGMREQSVAGARGVPATVHGGANDRWTLTLALVPACLMMTQIIYAALVATGATLPAIPAAFAGLLASTLGPWPARANPAQRYASRALAVVSSLVFGYAILLGQRSPTSGNGDSLVYAIDTDTHAAYWFTYDLAPDRWVQQRIGALAAPTPLPALTRWQRPLLAAHAPALELPPARVIVDHPAPVANPRIARLTIEASREVRCVELWQQAGPAILGSVINARATRRFVRFSPELDARLLRLLTGDPTRPTWHLRHCGARGSPLVIEFEVRDPAPLELELVEERAGLPDLPGAVPLQARDPSCAALQASDVTLSARKLTL